MRGRFVLAAAVSCSGWLLATRIVHRFLFAEVNSGGVLQMWLLLGFLMLAIPAFILCAVASLLYYWHHRTEPGRAHVYPLLLNVVALALFLFVPLGRLVDEIDLRLHYDARAEIVRRIEAGELWNGSPLFQIVHVGPQYPRAVSDGGGQRAVTVYREDGALRVGFHPQTGLGEASIIMYSADDRAPAVPNQVLPYAVRSERLAEHWYRVVSRSPWEGVLN